MVEIIEEIIDGVCSKDLVSNLSTQHDLLLVLLNGSSKSWPQLKPIEKRIYGIFDVRHCLSYT